MMKHLRAFLVFCLLASVARSATPELSGLFILGGKPRFVLVDPATGASSGWVALGDEFAGHTLREFRAETETLILVHAGSEIPLRLRDAKIKDASIAFAGSIEVGAGKALNVGKLTLVFGEQQTFPLEPGLVLKLKATKLSDGNIRYSSRFVKTGGDGKEEVIGGPDVVARPGDVFSVRSSKYGFTLKP